MDPNQITTTFIPKAPIQTATPEIEIKRSAPLGTLLIISIIVGLLATVLIVGVFLYKKVIVSDIENLQKTLKQAETTLDPKLIEELTRLDKRLKNSESLLRNHTVVSPIFDLIEQYTLKTVRFSKFDLIVDGGVVNVSMAGEANNYQSIALQSQNFGEVTHFKDVIFSDFTLTPKNRISFSASFSVSPSILKFITAPLKTTITSDNSQNVVVPQSSQSAPTSVQTTQTTGSMVTTPLTPKSQSTNSQIPKPASVSSTTNPPVTDKASPGTTTTQTTTINKKP